MSEVGSGLHKKSSTQRTPNNLNSTFQSRIPYCNSDNFIEKVIKTHTYLGRSSTTTKSQEIFLKWALHKSCVVFPAYLYYSKQQDQFLQSGEWGQKKVKGEKEEKFWLSSKLH